MRVSLRFRHMVLFFSIVILALSSLAQAKVRVAVLEFEDKAASTIMGAGRGVADILATKLINTGKYDVMERLRINDIVSEQSLSAAGQVDINTAARSGMLKGVQVLIFGSVTKFTTKDSSLGIGNIRVGKTDAEVEVQLRMVDTSSGAVLLAESASAKTMVPRAEAMLRINIDFSSSGFESSALGKATHKCVDELVNKIAGKLATANLKPAVTAEGYVILVKGTTIYIDLGRNAVQSGAKLDVYRQEESIIHPITKEPIPGDMIRIGAIKVFETQDKLSKCSIESLIQGYSIDAGDKVRLNQ